MQSVQTGFPAEDRLSGRLQTGELAQIGFLSAWIRTTDLPGRPSTVPPLRRFHPKGPLAQQRSGLARPGPTRTRRRQAARAQ